MAFVGVCAVLPASTGTSLESPQAMMLEELAGVRKGIYRVDRSVWQDAQAGQLCFSREAS